jgi:hypothetical protein
LVLLALINPILLAITAGLAMAVCHAAGVRLHQHEMLLALVVFLLASQAAIAPLLLQAKRTTALVTQMALVGLALHLLVGAILAISTMLVLKAGMPFAYWSLLFYWTSLIGVAGVFVRAVRVTTQQQTETGQTDTGQTETGQTETGQTETGQTEIGKQA